MAERLCTSQPSMTKRRGRSLLSFYLHLRRSCHSCLLTPAPQDVVSFLCQQRVDVTLSSHSSQTFREGTVKQLQKSCFREQRRIDTTKSWRCKPFLCWNIFVLGLLWNQSKQVRTSNYHWNRSNDEVEEFLQLWLHAFTFRFLAKQPSLHLRHARFEIWRRRW